MREIEAKVKEAGNWREEKTDRELLLLCEREGEVTERKRDGVCVFNSRHAPRQLLDSSAVVESELVGRDDHVVEAQRQGDRDKI